MLKKHLSVLVLLVMAVGAFAQSIPSGTARYEALGYNPFIMDAATDMNRNPAWGGMYRNYTFGDIGRSSVSYLELSEQYIGANFGLGKEFTAGLILNRPEGKIFGGSISGYYNGLGVSSPIVPFEGIVAYSTKTVMVGLGLNYAAWSSEVTSTSTADSNLSSSVMGGTIGVVYKMKGGWIEGNVDVRINKYKSEIVDTNFTATYENDDGLELNFVARGYFMVSKPNKINLVPYIGFSMMNWQPKVTTTPTATNTAQPEYKTMSFNGGVGINMPVLDDGMLAGGVSLGYLTDEVTLSDTTGTFETKRTDLVAPGFNLGLEWNFTDWLTGRAGYSRSVTSRKDESTFTPTSGTVSSRELTVLLPSNSEQTVTLGLGWHFGRFAFDGLIGERFFKEGPNVVSGQTNDLYAIISASYNFNK